MSACVPTRTDDPTARARPRPDSPHAAPPRRRFRIAGADLSASIAVFLIAAAALPRHRPRHRRPAPGRPGRRRRRRHRRRPARRLPAPGQRPRRRAHRGHRRSDPAATAGAPPAPSPCSPDSPNSAWPRCGSPARALAVSPAIVHGMLAGIGVTIALAQLHIVLGGTPAELRRRQRPRAARPVGRRCTRPRCRSAPLTIALLLALATAARAGRAALRKVPAALAAVAGRDRRRRARRAQPAPGGPAVLEQPRPARAARGPGARPRRRRPDHHPGRAACESLLSAVAVDKLVAGPQRTHGAPRVPRARPRPRAGRPGRRQYRLRRARRAARRRGRRPQRRPTCRPARSAGTPRCCTACGCCSPRCCWCPSSS